jgi:hypothetical protein
MKSVWLFTLAWCLVTQCYAQADDGRLIVVPVVFHVIYIDNLPDNGMGEEVRNGQTGNSTTRLPKEKIQAELDELNRDFQGLNPHTADVIREYKNVVGNPKIRFVLKDIKYVESTPQALKGCNNSETFHSLSTMVETTTTLNVYIGTLRVSCGGSEGVTNVPGSLLPSIDAVNLNYSWVGLGYHLLSHEVGHWLGLWHVDDPSQFESGITDIPVQTDRTDIDCVECTKPSVKVIRRMRDRFTSPNTNNYMDYSGCRSMFSIMQCTYMRNLVIRLRPVIWSNSIK